MEVIDGETMYQLSIQLITRLWITAATIDPPPAVPRPDAAPSAAQSNAEAAAVPAGLAPVEGTGWGGGVVGWWVGGFIDIY